MTKRSSLTGIMVLIAALLPGVSCQATLPGNSNIGSNLLNRNIAANQGLILWYNQPAGEKSWASQALPLGNGSLGCMVFGGVDREHIQFNEDSLWTGDANPSGKYGPMGAYQNFGDLYVSFDATGKAAPSAGKRRRKALPLPADIKDYRRSLDIGKAIVNISYRDTNSGVTYRREYFASHPAGVIVLHYTADKPGALTGVVSLKDAHKAVSHVVGNRLIDAGELPNKLVYEAQVKVTHRAGTVRLQNDSISFSNCDSVTILLAAGTNYAMNYAHHYRGPLPHKKLTQLIDKAALTPYQTLKQRHIRDYQALFDRVSINLGVSFASKTALPTDQRLQNYKQIPSDPGLEALLFQYGRYLLISCSRPGSLPANLQGLWNNSNNPPWHCDYHSNINIQMNYWLAEPTNLSECHLPFLNLVEASLPEWRKATRKDFGNNTPGWTVRTSHNIFGGMGWQWNITSNAWYAQHFWWHYAFGRNKKYLREEAYPLLKEVCRFWEVRLKTLPNGKLVVPNGWSPEHGPREDGCSYDQEIVWDLFTNTIDAADALGIDKTFRNHIADLRSKLLWPKIGRWGQLQEWMEDRDNPNDHHRHTSHLFAVYPGRQITLTSTPKLAAAAAVSLEHRGQTGDSRRSWTWPWRCALWARLGQPSKAYNMVQGLLKYNMLPNLLAVHPPMQMDGSFGITAGICEMLLQSQNGYIQLLPALPSAWAKGHINGLVARGDFVVDMKWQKGKLTSADIKSRVGGVCSIYINNLAGGNVTITHKGSPVKVSRHTKSGVKTLSFDTSAGNTYHIVPLYGQ